MGDDEATEEEDEVDRKERRIEIEVGKRDGEGRWSKKISMKMTVRKKGDEGT